MRHGRNTPQRTRFLNPARGNITRCVSGSIRKPINLHQGVKPELREKALYNFLYNYLNLFRALGISLLDGRSLHLTSMSTSLVVASTTFYVFIEGWYNPSRRHSALGYKSPINYERSAAEGLESPSL